MCIYTVKKQKSSTKGVRDSIERPKLGVSGVKDILKIVFTSLQESYMERHYILPVRTWHA